MDTKEYPVLVSIQCLVYNHEPYLRQCLDGFVMQKADFPFEAIVHDDASTDNSAAIIREYAEKYPDIIKPIYEIENQYSKDREILRRIVNDACKGKYIALCEGDDYWTDPHKLQIQVSFLESHPDYTMCCHGAVNINLEGLVWYTKPNSDCIVSTKTIIEEGGGLIPTLSIVYRSSLMKGLAEFTKGLSIGDYPLNIYSALNGKVMFMENVMGVHTLGGADSWHVRVANDVNKYSLFVSELQDWLDDLDKQTKGKYHDSICFCKITTLMSLCKMNDDYSMLRFYDGLWYYLKKMSLKYRMILFLRVYYFNWLVNFFLFVKNRVKIIILGSLRLQRFI